jgi:hypothetical protein
MNPDETQELEAQRAAIDEQMEEIGRWMSFWSERFSHTHVGQPIGESDKSLIGQFDAVIEQLGAVRDWIDRHMAEEGAAGS